jgi:threonine dehydratase
MKFVITPSASETIISPALDQLESAAEIVHRVLPPTPQICWPRLCERTGVEVWVKHENHTPLGAFKVRGGLVYVDQLSRREPAVAGVIAATRGNHGQSIAFAAKRAGLRAVIVVPYGNSVEKNAAMRSLGAELIEHGHDFQDAYEYSARLADEQHLHFVQSFDPALVCGVASYALELCGAVLGLDAIYVPIGMGSGICGCIAVRDALRLKTEIVAVTAESAPSFLRSYEAGYPIEAAVAPTIADGMACRTQHPAAMSTISKGAARVVVVSENEIRAAMRIIFSDTHNVAEGAGAAAFAALLKEADRMKGRRVAVILSGGNVDSAVFRQITAGELVVADPLCILFADPQIDPH